MILYLTNWNERANLKATIRSFKIKLKKIQLKSLSAIRANSLNYWPPHHPVYKQDDNATFETYPVFNALLNSQKKQPSLNESAYQRINNIQDMHTLINDYVV